KENVMFKTDIINAIASKTGNTKTSVEDMLDSFVSTVIETVKKGQDVNLIGFGSFKVVNTKAKTGRNPRTGKEIKIPAGKKVKFTIGKTLKDSVKK
ncbi:MAG TPA: HU family DNA-binding protein, partial [Rickettsiales bacterium]|nr:HU family DNA-binding protein [Rickettsiales bacterium]